MPDWTKEWPTEIGYYWFYQDDDTPQIVEIFNFQGRLMCIYMGDSDGWGFPHEEFSNGHWYGPLQQPLINKGKDK